MTVSRREFLSSTAGTAASLALAGCGRPAQDTDVIVIGAGLSGLHAARQLEKAGVSVIVLEGSSRIGGRVQTLYDKPGAPEIGAADVGTIYRRVLATSSELGLEPKQWPGGMPSYWFHFKGQSFTAKQWPDLEINDLEGKVRKIAPSGIAQYFMPRPLPLPDIDAWLRDEFAQYDIPYGQFLRNQGASAAALKYAAIGSQFDDLDSISTLWQMRMQKWSLFSMEQAFAEGAPIRYFMDGGMSRLTDEMGASLAQEVRRDHWVNAIEQDERGVTIRCENGSKLSARFVVCTVPLTTLRNIAIEPALPPLVAEAVAQIPYGTGTSILLNIIEPFWEEDGMPPNFYTDLPIERAFIAPSPIGENDHLWVFTTGPNDLARTNMTEDEMGQFTIRELNRVRPSTIGRLEPLAVRSWTRDPTCLGTYASRAPGQATRFATIFQQPAGRLVFAGEHTSIRDVGIEGAMESGETAASAVIANL